MTDRVASWAGVLINSIPFILFCRVLREAISGARFVGPGRNWKGKVGTSTSTSTSTSGASCNPARQPGGARLVGTYLRSRPGTATTQHTSAQRTFSLFFPRFPPSPDLVSFSICSARAIPSLSLLQPPFPCSSHQTCALLGLHSRTSRLSWHRQPCRTLKPFVGPATQQQRRSKPKGLATSSKMAPGRSKGKQPARPRDETLRFNPTPKTQGLYNAFRQLEDAKPQTSFASPASSHTHPTADTETNDGQPPAKKQKAQQKAQRNGPLDELKRAKAAFMRAIRACQDCNRRGVAVSCPCFVCAHPGADLGLVQPLRPHALRAAVPGSTPEPRRDPSGRMGAKPANAFGLCRPRPNGNRILPDAHHEHLPQPAAVIYRNRLKGAVDALAAVPPRPSAEQLVPYG